MTSRAPACRGAPEHYVRRMVVNEYLSWRRRWSRMVPHADPPICPDHAATHAERDALRAELDKLPRRHRPRLCVPGAGPRCASS